MHNNYFFIRAMAQALGEKLRGYRWATCFSQDKEELILGFENGVQEFWLRATLLPELTALAFPETFARAKRNSIELLTAGLGADVLGVELYENERAFSLLLSGDKKLLFKLFTAKANVLLLEDEEVIDLFMHRHEDDWDLQPAALPRHFDLTLERLQQAENFRQFLPTLPQEFIAHENLKSLSPEEALEKTMLFLEKIKNTSWYVWRTQSGAALSCYAPDGEVTADYAGGDVLEAANTFFWLFSSTFYLEKERKSALKLLGKRQRQTRSYLKKSEKKYIELEEQARYREEADILMANLHQIPKGAKEATLFDFYRNEEITIRLKPQLSPQKNAENLYRKAKNQKIELQNLEKNIAQKEQQLDKLEQLEEKITQIDRLRELRKLLKKTGLQSDTQKQAEQKPYREFTKDGWRIWVGKNARQNDQLTQRFAHKEDLWLHARDTPGSHVVIKQQAGKTIPKPVLERAAELAAWYSKRKHDSLCPVMYTPKKYVRKPKGSPPGAVLVEKESVILVKPQA